MDNEGGDGTDGERVRRRSSSAGGSVAVAAALKTGGGGTQISSDEGETGTAPFTGAPTTGSLDPPPSSSSLLSSQPRGAL
jgi:hypothetical protein